MTGERRHFIDPEKWRVLLSTISGWFRPLRWHTVVRDDLGLRIELPGRPVFDTEPDYDEDGTEYTVTTVGTVVGDLCIELSYVPLFRRMDFEAFIERYESDMTELFRLPFLGRQSLLWHGHPAADLAYGAPGHYVLIRYITTRMATIGVTASDRVPVQASPVVGRVLDSLVPLRAL
jgi:hypothetical protein